MKHQRRFYLAAAGVMLLLTVLLSAGQGLFAPRVSFASDAPAAPGTDLTVYCFQAGSADAFLLRTPNSAVLIDTGEKSLGKEILRELAARGIGKLDCLIISHFDQDHVGGAAKVIGGIPVDRVLQTNHLKESSEVKKYLKALSEAGIEAETVREDLTFTLDGVTWAVNPPALEDYRKDDSNNASLIVRVTNGENSFLFMGDAETERLDEFLRGGAQPCDVLKVPHHGRADPMTEALLRAVRPRYAVISSSEEELESDAVKAALNRAGAQVLLTRLGPVTFVSDGKTVRVE